MDAATAFAPPAHLRGENAISELDAGRVRDIILVRIATAGKVLARSDLGHDLWPLVSHLLSLAAWKSVLDRDLGALADAGLCDAKPIAVSVTDAGLMRAALVLGVNTLPRTWSEAKAGRLVAKALGLGQQTPRRVKTLQKADGLRAAIVQQSYAIKLRGLPTPARLRVQLAKLALARAFGTSRPAGVDDRSGLSAKAGRSLAGRLAIQPREFATDSRLIAALATEAAGASKSDFESLQTALLRRYVTRGPIAPPAPVGISSNGAKASPANASPPVRKSGAIVHLVATPGATTTTARPGFMPFVVRVREFAVVCAEGWPGNRKAFVSKVWSCVKAYCPEWNLSEVEFKAMLTEAHRSGEIVLVNADLKDQRSIAEIQASAIAYKNTIFHYVRVDD